MSTTILTRNHTTGWQPGRPRPCTVRAVRAFAAGREMTVDGIPLAAEPESVQGSTATAIPQRGPTPQGAPCPSCGSAVDPLRARHLAVVGGKVVPFCSPACRDRACAAPDGGGLASPASSPLAAPARPAPLGRFLLAAGLLLLLAGMTLGARISVHWPTAVALPPPVPPISAAEIPFVGPPPEPLYGPEPPPPEYQAESDLWVHPLRGPVRRLPERSGRRFGAERDHDSPESCGQGHCGVDLGELKGEPVLAVHNGVVEKVVRFEIDERSGKYIRLLHYGGRVITSYMHLDSIAAELQPGMHVRAGEVIGTVGDSGVKNSGPHLHFTFATRAAENAPEVYVDPLALLTVWPLRQP